jgi:hypothetical protein
LTETGNRATVDKRGSESSGRRREDIQSRAVSSHGNDSCGNLNPDANDYAPRGDSGEFNLNAIEISPVN